PVSPAPAVAPRTGSCSTQLRSRSSSLPNSPAWGVSSQPAGAGFGRYRSPSASTTAGSPGSATRAGTSPPPRRKDHVRQRRRDGGGRSLGAEESDVTRATVNRAIDRHHRSTWVLI